MAGSATRGTPDPSEEGAIERAIAYRRRRPVSEIKAQIRVAHTRRLDYRSRALEGDAEIQTRVIDRLLDEMRDAVTD